MEWSFNPSIFEANYKLMKIVKLIVSAKNTKSATKKPVQFNAQSNRLRDTLKETVSNPTVLCLQ